MSNRFGRLNQLLYARCPVPSPLPLAMQLGWVEEAMYQLANIEVRSLFESTNPTDIPRHFDINQLNAFRQGGSAPVIWAKSKQQDTRVIGLTWTDEYQSLIALPQSGIQSVKDLRGRRIGLPKHNVPVDHSRIAALRGFSVMLESEGLSLKDVEIIDLLDHEIPTQVRDGQIVSTGTGRRGRYSYSSEIHAISHALVDAVYVKDVRGAQATHLLGAQVIANINQHPDPYVRLNNCTPRPLTINSWLLENYPHLVDCLLLQTYMAGDWALHHPNETLALLSREVGWSENWIHYAYGTDIHKNLQLDLNAENIKHLGLYKDFLMQHQFITQDFSINQWIDHEPMERLLRKHRSVNRRKTLSLNIKPDTVKLNGLIH
jgi:ABC-type nitrate/sulfonate/bicarbonate transport system substrate-binding protein